MKSTMLFLCLSATLSSRLFCGCSTSRLDLSNIDRQSPETMLTNASNASLKDQSGAERVFTNANVVMWVPSRAKRVYDGPTSYVSIDETTASDAFIHAYKIKIGIQVFTEPEFKRYHSKDAPDWYFQEHPTLSMMDAPIGKALRKDIQDTKRGRILLINGTVRKSDTFQEDIETAKKMVESITLIPK